LEKDRLSGVLREASGDVRDTSKKEPGPVGKKGESV